MAHALQTAAADDRSPEQRARDLADSLAYRPPQRPPARATPALATIAPLAIATPAGDMVGWRHGSGPAVLLVHGAHDTHRIWSVLIDRLIERGRAFVAIDLPGYGMSPSGDDSIQAWTDALLAVPAGFGPIDAVVAHSRGALTALRAIAQGLAVDKAVLIAPPMPTRPDLVQVDPRVEALPRTHPDIAERVTRLYMAERPWLGDDDGFDPQAAVRGFTIPALFVHSRNDGMIHHPTSEILAAAWPGADLLMLDAPTHRETARIDPVVTAIADFV